MNKPIRKHARHPCAPTPLLSHCVSYSRSAAAPETIDVAHCFHGSAELCSHVGISGDGRPQEEQNTGCDAAFGKGPLYTQKLE